jgi:hypothetical protein
MLSAPTKTKTFLRTLATVSPQGWSSQASGNDSANESSSAVGAGLTLTSGLARRLPGAPDGIGSLGLVGPGLAAQSALADQLDQTEDGLPLGDRVGNDSLATRLSFRHEIVVGPGGSQLLLDHPAGNPIELFSLPADGNHESSPSVVSVSVSTNA